MEEKFRKPLRLQKQKFLSVDSLIEYGKKIKENLRVSSYFQWANSNPSTREELEMTCKEYDALDPHKFIEEDIKNKLVRCMGVDEGTNPNYERWHVNNTLFSLCREGGMRSGEWDIPASVVVFFDEMRELLYVGVPGYKFYGHLARLCPMVHFFSDGTCFETTELVDMKSFLMLTKKELKITKRYIKERLKLSKTTMTGEENPQITDEEINHIYKQSPSSIHEHKLFDMEYYVFKGFRRNQKKSDYRAKEHLKKTKNTAEDFRKARSLGISCVFDPEQELSYLLTTPENMKKLGGDVHPSGAIYRFPNYFKKCEGKEFRKPENLFEFMLNKSNTDIFNIMVNESVDLWNRKFYNQIQHSPEAKLEIFEPKYTIEEFNKLLDQKDNEK